MGPRFRYLAAAAVLAATLLPAASMAQADGFAAYLRQLRERAIAQGVRPATADRVLPTLSYNARVVELDRAQPEGRPDAPIPMFEPYRRRHVDAARIGRGRAKYAELRPLLARVEAETGVPEEIMLAIYGHETNYGAYTGGFDAPRALASLAYEGRRRELFEGEFIAALKMIDRGISPALMTGSWAGALGKPQFLPSVYLRLARDGDGDRFADIWNSEADALASIANYFRAAGWQPGERWGAAVRVPAGLNRGAIAATVAAPRCPRVHARHSRWMSVAEWRALGVTVSDGRGLADTTLAALIEPDGPNGTGYLLTGNYRAILEYNCSNFYALSVGLLADAIH